MNIAPGNLFVKREDTNEIHFLFILSCLYLECLEFQEKYRLSVSNFISIKSGQ